MLGGRVLRVLTGDTLDDLHAFGKRSDQFGLRPARQVRIRRFVQRLDEVQLALHVRVILHRQPPVDVNRRRALLEFLLVWPVRLVKISHVCVRQRELPLQGDACRVLRPSTIC